MTKEQKLHIERKLRFVPSIEYEVVKYLTTEEYEELLIKFWEELELCIKK